MKKSILSDKEFLQKLFEGSVNYSEVLSKAGVTSSSGNYRTLIKYAKKFEIDFKEKKKRKELIRKTYSDENCFKVNSEIARHHVKKRIIDNKLIEYKCCECGMLPIWNGKDLVLQLEHKNGINDDNRLCNLAFICPNCHSQTKTYAARNKIKDTSLV